MFDPFDPIEALDRAIIVMLILCWAVYFVLEVFDLHMSQTSQAQGGYVRPTSRPLSPDLIYSLLTCRWPELIPAGSSGMNTRLALSEWKGVLDYRSVH